MRPCPPKRVTSSPAHGDPLHIPRKPHVPGGWAFGLCLAVPDDCRRTRLWRGVMHSCRSRHPWSGRRTARCPIQSGQIFSNDRGFHVTIHYDPVDNFHIKSDHKAWLSRELTAFHYSYAQPGPPRALQSELSRESASVYMCPRR